MGCMSDTWYAREDGNFGCCGGVCLLVWHLLKSCKGIKKQTNIWRVLWGRFIEEGDVGGTDHMSLGNWWGPIQRSLIEIYYGGATYTRFVPSLTFGLWGPSPWLSAGPLDSFFFFFLVYSSVGKQRGNWTAGTHTEYYYSYRDSNLFFLFGHRSLSVTRLLDFDAFAQFGCL